MISGFLSYLNSMTLHQFNQLSEGEQYNVLRRAVLLADRDEPLYDVYLFQVDAFYVEVYCYKNTPDLDRYKAFESTDLLEPYLDRMKIAL